MKKRSDEDSGGDWMNNTREPGETAWVNIHITIITIIPQLRHKWKSGKRSMRKGSARGQEKV